MPSPSSERCPQGPSLERQLGAIVSGMQPEAWLCDAKVARVWPLHPSFSGPMTGAMTMPNARANARANERAADRLNPVAKPGPNPGPNPAGPQPGPGPSLPGRPLDPLHVGVG